MRTPLGVRGVHIMAMALALWVGAFVLAPAAVEATETPVAQPTVAPTGAATAQAAEDAAPTPPREPGKPRWYPPEAKPEDAEWVKLKSGEWLRGKITVMRKEELEFDSDELDDLKLDWDDVLEVHSPRINTFAFTDRRFALGVGKVTETQVIVLTALGEQTYPRSELLSILSGGTSEWNYWSGKLTAGFTLLNGNTNQFNGQLAGELKRRTAFNRFTTTYTGNYGTQNQANTVNNQSVNSRLDLFIYKRVFVTPAVIDFYTDQFQNIRYRLSPGAGVGYDILDKHWINLTLGLDGMYRATTYFSVQPGEDITDRDAALRVSASWDIDFTSDLELKGGYNVTMGIPDPKNTNQHFDSTFSLDITKIFSFNVSVIWDRVGEPQPDSQGVTPLQDDVTLTAGIGIEF